MRMCSCRCLVRFRHVGLILGQSSFFQRRQFESQKEKGKYVKYEEET